MPSTTVKSKRLRDYDVSFFHQLIIMIWSCLLAFVSVAPLFVNQLATAIQGHQFYLGWAFLRGQLPYVDVFSQSGLLYNALVAGVSYIGGMQWLIPVQLCCLYLSGLYLYKLIYYWTDTGTIAIKLVGLFYLLHLTFGFGGFYPIQFAMPFVLIGLWIVVTAIADLRRDEVFISYGLVAAIALALEPRTFIFWILAFLSLTVNNVSKGFWARGFYQNLAMLFGFIWIAYPLAYVGINVGVWTAYIQQAFSENFTNLLQFSSLNYVTLSILVLMTLASGLLTGLFSLPRLVSHMVGERVSLVLLTLTTLSYFIVALLSDESGLSSLLFVLPFGLLLTGLKFGRNQLFSDNKKQYSRRRYAVKTDISFLRGHAYLPVLVVLAGLIWSAWPVISQQSVARERQVLSRYLVSNTTETEQIYAWDNSVDVYLSSQRLAASQIPVVTAYSSQISQQIVVDDLLEDKASYIVVNKSLVLPEDLMIKLSKDYQLMSVDGVNGFDLYQKK